jgi:very-short-patch-repair endonuclease
MKKSEKWYEAMKARRGKAQIEYVDFTCPFCNEVFSHKTPSAKGLHINFCFKNPNRKVYKGHSISDETKKRISLSMKKAISEGRATGWHKRKAGTQSYPEQWFEKVIQNEFEDKDYVTELSVGKWFLDFAWKKKMLYIEIDGEQHNDPNRAKSDAKKDEFCKELGWKCLRLQWRYICSHTQEAIKAAKDFIDNGKVCEVEWVDKKALKKKELETLKNEGRINSLGRATSACLNPEVWEQRKDLILNSGVDLMKFGWISEVMKKTNLSKGQVYNTIKKFNLDCYKLDRAEY